MTNIENRSRREFLKMGATSALVASVPIVFGEDIFGKGKNISRRTSTKSNKVGPLLDFEVTGSIYAWQVHDEGIDQILDNMSIAGINSVYLITPMHGERRPFIGWAAIQDQRENFFFPHNPVRKEWFAEDSRIYHNYDESMYGRIKPQKSDYSWLAETDWLEIVIDAARARGFKVGAEVSHTYIPRAMLDRNPEWKQQNLDGDLRRAPCINHPDVREYLMTLYADLAKNYDIDYIMTCMYIFSGDGTSNNSSCICQSCQNEAKEMGFDLTAAIPIIRDNRQAYPEMVQFLKFREESTTQMYKAIIDRMREENQDIGFRLNDLNNRQTGLNLEELRSHITSVHIASHQEQLGQLTTQRESRIRTSRYYIGPDIPVLASVTTRLFSMPDMIVHMIQISVEEGVQGIGVKHYDGSPFSRLRAVRNGLHAAGVEGFSPILGIEADRDMSVTGFERDAFLTETCIKLTEPTGTAWSSFKYPAGNYDIAVTYTDERDIQGTLELLVAGRKIGMWSLNENVDCWRRKIIPNIDIRNGEEIRLVGIADGNVGHASIRLDFIEFIPI